MEQKDMKSMEIETIKEAELANVGKDLTLEESVEGARKYIKLQAEMRQLSVLVTNVEDWIDQDGKAYLEWTGAAKIARAFGISYDPPEFERTIERDEEGEYIIFTCVGTVRWKNQSMVEMGTSSTRDRFFCVRGGERLPLSEIDLNNIKKKAMTNWLNRGIKSLLGLSFTWDEIAAASGGKVTKEKCQGVKYASGIKGGKTDSNPGVAADDRSRVWKMLMDMAGGDAAAAAKHLYVVTVWRKGDQEMPGKSRISDVSEAMLKHVVPRVEKEYSEWQKLNSAVNGGQQ